MGVRVLLMARRAWWRLGWGLFARIWCPGLQYDGLDRIPRGPVVFAANHASHASHADTVVIQLLLARAGKMRVLVAAAADYWFRGRVLGLIAQSIGGFSFPRSGGEGVGKACKALRRGWSVLIYPQGTRSGGPFRPGVAIIASRSRVPVVPVFIEGTGRLLPKGRFWPRRSAVTVRFGDAIHVLPGEPPATFATRLHGALDSEVVEREVA